jgi:hypothetical protein
MKGFWVQPEEIRRKKSALCADLVKYLYAESDIPKAKIIITEICSWEFEATAHAGY